MTTLQGGQSRGVEALPALALSIPIALGYVPLGAVFGFLLVQAGAAWWLAPAMSLLVFAGAAQFMAIPMLAAGASVGEIVLATAIINLRHVFYGLSLLQRLPTGWWARGYLVWALTDETYSVLTTMPEGATAAQMVGVSMLNHFWWVLGSLLGALLGAQLTLAFNGIEFSLAALFAVLTVEQWRATRRILPIGVALLAYPAASWLLPSQALLVSLALSLAAAVALVSRGGTSRRA